MTTRPMALLTGASSGIGRALAQLMAARGYDCIITARREERLKELTTSLEEAGVTAHTVPHDLGVHGGAQALHAKVAEAGHVVDVLINCAGFGVYGPAWEQKLERTQAMLELNMTALTVLTQLFVADMVKRDVGRVLQVASIGAYQPSPFYAAYSATKAYVLSYSQALNWELQHAGSKVTVTTICPGLTATEFHEQANHIKPKSMDPLMMTSEEVAAIGLKAMFKGRAVVTPGFSNKMSAGLVKMMPRSWATAVAGKMMVK